MGSEKTGEEIVRIVNCINSCWPEYPFTYDDIRKPSREKFMDVLSKFLKGSLGSNYQLPGVNMHDFSRNPEMFSQFEGTFSLYRAINSVFKDLGITNFKYAHLIRPTTNIARETLLGLVNFLAYFEAEEANKEEVEAEVQNLRHQTIQNEKRLVEEERYLDKCRQNHEEKKIMGTELRRLLVNRKEKYLKIEVVVTKSEAEVEDITKRINSTKFKLEQAANTLKQVEMEKEKAAEAVVPDPEALEAELRKSLEDKETMEADFKCLKSRLPVLEQQIQDRKLQHQDHKETQQRLEHIKDRESIIKGEWEKTESEFRRVDEEKQNLENQLKKYTSLNESMKRMLEESNQNLEQIRGKLEEALSDVQQRKSEKAQMTAQVQSMENDIAQLKQKFNSGEKALEEGVAVLEAIHLKHRRDLEELDLKYQKNYEEMQKQKSMYLDSILEFCN